MHAATSAGIFNAEKLLWLNFHYLKERPNAQLAREIKPFIAKAGYRDSGRRCVAGKNGRDAARARQDAGRAGRLREVLSERRYRRSMPRRPRSSSSPRSPNHSARSPMRSTTLDRRFQRSLRCRRVFERVLARFSMKLGQLAQPVRVALTGGTVSPGIYEVIAVLGRERTVARLRKAIAQIG